MCNGVKSLWTILSCFVVIQAYADTKTWTGGAGNALFSSASNWNPAGAPASGDALVFANSSALNVTNDLVGYSFSGITVSGSAAVTFQSGGNGFTLTGDIAITGSRELNLAVPVTLNSAVTLNVTNASFYAYSPITGTGGITVIGGKDFYAKDAVALTNGVTVNRGRLIVEKTTFTAPVTLNQLSVGGSSYVSMTFQNSGTYKIPITLANSDGNNSALYAPGGAYVTNTAPVTLAPSAYTRWRPDGSITHAGGIIVQTPARSDMTVIFNGNHVISTVPIAFTNDLFFDNGTLRLAVAGNTYASLRCFTSTLYTDVPYALDPDKTVLFGTSYSKNGTIDLNGNEQIINRPVLNTLDLIDTSSYAFTSTAKPATLRCRATASTTFFGSLNGALSLSWEPTSAYTLVITGRLSQTTGSLSVNAGTLRLAASSAFPNLTGLVATNTGTLRVEAADINAGCALTLSDSAQLSLPTGFTLTCLTALIDGNILTAGVYTASSTINSRSFITGEGALRVLAMPLSGVVRTWTGAGADNRFSTVENWDSTPTFDGSETLLFTTAGSTGLVDTVVRAGAVRFNRNTPFTLLPADASSALRLGLGGITTLSPVNGTALTNTLNVPVELAHISDWQIATNHFLTIAAPISGGVTTVPFIKSGPGTLWMTGTNTFDSPLIISNGYVRVNNGTALGNPTNTITFIQSVNTSDNWNQRGFLYFTDMVVTNDRPFILNSSATFIGQIYPKNGTLVLNGKVTFLGGGRIDNQGGLVLRGGLSCVNADPWLQTLPGYVTRLEQQPLTLGTRIFQIDNGGTFNVAATNNTWASMALSSGILLCGAENVIPTNSYASFGRSWTQAGAIDLNGFNQQLKYLTYSSGTTASTNMAVRSTTPATLTLQGDSGTRPFIGYFSGKASLRYKNTGALIFTGRTATSTTSGDLLIDSGSVVFTNGAAWTGSSNITVSAGTLAVFGGTNATFGGSNPFVNKTRLHLTASSTVYLASGLSEYVRSLTIGGTNQPIGTYGSTNSIAQYKSTFFAGSGILNVMRSEIPATLLLIR